jgi:predicted membrane channel-forming protein YqfA (hemolysin III family)
MDYLLIAKFLAVFYLMFVFYLYYRDLFNLAKNSRMLKKILGFVLVMIGIAGIFLPIVPGWLLIFVGLGLMKVLFLEKLVKRLARRFGVEEKPK